ncbi:MAG TPA: hypothetical protein VGR07_05920, partial [Thermoanaerobaculia bacterium]|nr:hypothetical protein [Thermoanaerobaculia bacterium]
MSNGLGEEEILGRTAHEVRGLACHPLDDRQVLVLAGDKLGKWWAGAYSPAAPAPAALAWRELPRIPSPGERLRVIDRLTVVPWLRGHAVVVGTRGNGAWLAPLEAVLDPGWSNSGDLRPLPESDGKKVRRLLFDPTSATLWAAAGCELVIWSLAGPEPRTVRRERLGYRVTALAIDRGETPAEDHLYLATNRGTLHRLERGRDASFALDPAALVPERAVWRGRSSVIERLAPLSEVRHFNLTTGTWQRRYAERGVLGTTLRHLLLVCLREDPNAPAVSHSRLVVADSKILGLAVLCLPDWQSVAVSTLAGPLQLFHPSGVRHPGAKEFAPFPGEALENCSPTALLSGCEEISRLSDRVYSMVPLPSGSAESGEPAAYLSLVLALGDHTVRCQRLSLRWALQASGQRLAAAVAASADLDLLLDLLQAKSLYATEERGKNALLQLLPELGRHCALERQQQRLWLLVWDILAGSEATPRLPIATIEALRRLQALRPDQREAIEERITVIRKYILDRNSFSEKQSDLLTLARSSDPDLADDRVLYRSILCARRHDPVFIRDFRPEEFGEVQAFAPLPRRALDGRKIPFDHQEPGDRRFLVATYRGALWLLDGTGQACPLRGAAPEWGYVQAFHFRQGDAILAFSAGQLQRLALAPLLASWQNGVPVGLDLELAPLPNLGGTPPRPAYSLCAPPSFPDDERFLFGDAEGGIHLHTGNGKPPQPLADLREVLERNGIPLAVNELQSFLLPRLGSPPVPLVTAATRSGHLCLLGWSESPEPRLEIVDRARVGASAATSLLVAGTTPEQIVVGCTDGTVASYRLLAGVSGAATPADAPVRLALAWAFRAGEAVRSIQHLWPPTATQPLL